MKQGTPRRGYPYKISCMNIHATFPVSSMCPCVCGLLLLTSCSAWPAAPAEHTYYVSTTGNDSNRGDSGAPWRTIQKAADALRPGDTAVVAAGEYHERVQVRNSGASGASISFDGKGAVSMEGFRVSGSYVHVNGFEIANAPGNDLFNRALSSGIYCSGAGDVFSNNFIHGTNAVGIYLEEGSTRNSIISNRVVSAVEAGIYVRGTNHIVESNDISHTVQTHPGMLNSGDADGIRFFGSGSIFRKNYIHDITLADMGNTNPHIDGFQTWGPVSNITIERNTIVQAETGDQGIIIEGKYQPTGGIIIRNNVFAIRSVEFGPAVIAGGLGPVSNIQILNNTVAAVIGPAEYAFWLFDNVSKVDVRNNAVYDFGNAQYSYIRIDPKATDLNIGTNAVYKSDGKPPKGNPFPGDLWMVNPQFINVSTRDFHIRPTSPLIDAGVTLASVTDDFDGSHRPLGKGPDIGAFEAR
jgi:hypothetical protein